MTNPLLTVVLPAHNAEATIATAIQSVLSQSYPEFELWVLESNSKDRTAEIARSFSDPRVKVFELGSMSFHEVLVYALENARTEWLVRMDADDLSFPDRFKKQVQVIRQRPDVVLVGTRCVHLTPFGHIFETRPNVASREVGRLTMRLPGEQAKFFSDATVMFKRIAALEAGGYDPEFAMGDVPLWFRILSRGKGWEIATPLYLYRLHPDSMMNSEVTPSDQSYRLLVKYTPELLPLYYPGLSTWMPKPATWSTTHYWMRIATYEALTGDRKALCRTADFLEEAGLFKKQARLIRWFSYLGRAGALGYRWFRRDKYRHRPDLEKFFTDLYGPLTLNNDFSSTGSHR
jgi:glycosyltransferase involved in cell wall biosynthesis